jgi:hypothetical protein
MRLLKRLEIKFIALIGLCIGLLGVQSCTYYVETLESSVGNNYLADYNYSRIITVVQDALNAKYRGGSDIGLPIVLDTNSSNRIMSVDFGVEPQICYDGVIRRGKAIVTWQGNPYTPGTEILVDLGSGFLCNDWYFGGTIKLTYLDRNEFNQPEYLMETTGLVVKNASTQETFLWNNVYTRTKIAGDSTLKSVDDVWTISGTVYAKNEKGRYYNAIIKDSLHFVNACEYGIVKGRVDIAHVDDSQRNFVFYGTNPVCDKWYTFKRGDRVITITKNR